MAADFISIQDRVLNRLIDQPANTASEVPNLVNAAQRRLQQLHNFVVMEKTAVLTTTKNVRALSNLPTDFKQLRNGEPWYIDLNGAPVKMFWRPALEQVLGQFAYDDPNETGAPMVLLAVPMDSTGGSPGSGPTVQIQVWPYPDGQSQFGTGSVTTLKDPQGNTVTVASGEYPIFIPYWGMVADLSGNTDANWFTANAEDFLVCAALGEAFYMNWDEKRGAMWTARAYGPQFEAQGVIGGKAREVINLDKRRRVGTTNQLQVFRDAYGPRGRWYNGFTQVPGE